LSGVPADYFFGQDGLFVLPIDYLTPSGLEPAFAAEVVARGALGADRVGFFDTAFASYWQRAGTLRTRAPRYWFPPRIQHVCVVTASATLRPYFQPFHRNSWLCYASDFDPETSSPEFACYLFLHAERMNRIGEIAPSLYANLSYFLTLNDDQAADLAGGCRRSTRPDARGFRALADALPQVRAMHHETLKPPRSRRADQRRLPETGLIATDALRKPLERLQQSWSAAAAAVFERQRRNLAGRNARPGEALVGWLRETSPQVLITDGEGEKLWDPEQAEDTDALATALDDVTSAAEDSLRADLETVARHNRRFLDALNDVDDLASPAPYLTASGLAYIHSSGRLVAYAIGGDEQGHRLWEPTPPYERLMLAARTIHEWGHLAAESNFVIVPEEQADRRARLCEHLCALFDAIHAEAPQPVRDLSAREVAELEARSGSLGRALLDGMQVRIEDYMANLVARRFLDPDAMDTYVRNNVYSHARDYAPGQLYHQLCRQAYEFQYLSLSRIERPLEWFLKCTGFGEQYVASRVLSAAQLEDLLRTVAGICACYRVDESRFAETAGA